MTQRSNIALSAALKRKLLQSPIREPKFTTLTKSPQNKKQVTLANYLPDPSDAEEGNSKVESQRVEIEDSESEQTQAKKPLDSDMDSNTTTYIAYLKSTPDGICEYAERHPITFYDSFISAFGEPIDIQVHKKTKCIKVVLSTSDQQELIMNTSSFENFNIQASKPYLNTNQSGRPKTTINTNSSGNYLYKCIIHNVSIDLSPEDIQYATEAQYVQRISRFNATTREREPTKTVILGYSNEHPEIVKIGFMRHKTEPYTPKPIRCNNCQKFGHTTAKCHSTTQICSHCAGTHSYENCTTKQTSQPPKCANCSKEHSAAYTGCQTYQNTKKALEIRAIERGTFKEALLRVTKDESNGKETIPKQLDQTNLSKQDQNQTTLAKVTDDRFKIIEFEMQSLIQTIKLQAITIQELKENQESLKQHAEKELDKMENLISIQLAKNQDQMAKVMNEQTQTFNKNFDLIQAQINQIVINQNNFISQVKEIIKPASSAQTKPPSNQKSHPTTSQPQRK
jgi:hypothetical protein